MTFAPEISMSPSEKLGNLVPYPKAGTLADLIDWHLDFGTRPDGSPARPGKRWENKEFAGAVLAADVDPESGARSVRNWRAGRNRPQHLGSVERALFSDNEAYSGWRFDLRAAYDGDKQRSTKGADFPRPPAYFLGREKDLSDILDVVFGSSWPVSILVQGGPGIGKTSLTTAIANHAEISASLRPRATVVREARNSHDCRRYA